MWLTMQLLLPSNSMLAGLLRATSCCMLLVRPWRLRQPEMEITTKGPPEPLSFTTNYTHVVVACQKRNVRILNNYVTALEPTLFCHRSVRVLHCTQDAVQPLNTSSFLILRDRLSRVRFCLTCDIRVYRISATIPNFRPASFNWQHFRLS